MKQKSEFGTFISRVDGEYHILSIQSVQKNIDIGWIRSIENDKQTLDNVRLVFSRFIEAYLLILRTESKLAMFLNLPLNNEFKDAVLRNEIESQGQTLEVRKFIEEYDSVNRWITYPERAEFYILDDLIGQTNFAFITPYGRYHLAQNSISEYQIFRFREGALADIVEIKIPYNLLEKDLEQTAWLQAIDSLYIEAYDVCNRKIKELGKRSSETIKYIFGYDKLRLSLRNRGIQ